MDFKKFSDEEVISLYKKIVKPPAELFRRSKAYFKSNEIKKNLKDDKKGQQQYLKILKQHFLRT